MGSEKSHIQEPYKGLQPYTEENQDIFFGREQERDILIDKLLSSKLTFLFAATGVGKTSLLQASVIPDLKGPLRQNLDVVYFNDWVLDPLKEFKNTAIKVLKERGKIDSDYSFDNSLSLQEFFHVSSVFSS